MGRLKKLSINPGKYWNITRLVLSAITATMFYLIATMDESSLDAPYYRWIMLVAMLVICVLIGKSKFFLRTAERTNDYRILFYNNFFGYKLNRIYYFIDEIKGIQVSQNAKNYYVIAYELRNGKKVFLGKFAIQKQLEQFKEVVEELIRD